MLYEYQCNNCDHVMDLWRSVAQRNDPASCELCSSDMKKVLLTAPAGIVTEVDLRYVCPVTGQQITSWRERKNTFAKYDLIDANEVDQKYAKKKIMDKKDRRDTLAKDYLPPDLRETLRDMGSGNENHRDNFSV